MKEEEFESLKGGGEKETEEVKPWAIDFIALILLGRGVINLLFLLYGDYVDEFYLVGDTVLLLLHLFSIVAGIGIFLRARWGFYSGLIVSAIMFVFQGDENVLERLSGRLISITLLIGLIKVRGLFKKEELFDKVIIGIVLLGLLGAMGYDLAQPSETKLYDYWTDLAESKRDITLCENIENNNYREHCILMVNYRLQDPKVCEMLTIEDKRDSCYLDLAKKQLNVTYCTMIEGNYSQEFCFDYVKLRT